MQSTSHVKGINSQTKNTRKNIEINQQKQIITKTLSTEENLKFSNNNNNNINNSSHSSSSHSNSNNNNINDNNKNLENAKQKSSVTTSFLYKLTEIAAYTSAVASEAYQTFNKTLKTDEDDHSNNSFYDMYEEDNVLTIADGDETDLNDDELSDSDLEEDDDNNKSTNNKIKINKNNTRNINHGHDRKDSCSWSVNDEDEPPPPYDSSWTMPATSTNNNTGQQNIANLPKISTSPKKISFSIPQNEDQSTDTSSVPATPTRRRQIRVRRGRRLLRRKTSSVELQSTQRTNNGRGGPMDQDELLLKVNEKLSDMISQGTAALNSTVDVTEVEMMLSEEREREEKIMRELGLQSPVGRRNKRFTNSPSSDYEYYSSLSDSGSYSAPETSYCEYGYGSNSGFASPTGYDTPLRYGPTAHYNTPITYGSPGIYPSPGGYNNSNNNNNNRYHHHHHHHSSDGYNMLGSKFNESSPNEFSGPIPTRYHGIPPPQIQPMPQHAYNDLISNGYNVALPTGYANSPLPPPLSSPASSSMGNFVQNQIGGGGFGSNSSRFTNNMNGYGSNSKYGSGKMFNNDNNNNNNKFFY